MIDFSDLSPQWVVGILVLFLTGVVELMKAIGDATDPTKEDRTWRTVYIISGSAIAGAVVLPLFGNFIVGLNYYQLAIVGMILGFNASGAVTLVQNLGKKSSSPVEVVMPAMPTAVPVAEQTELETEETPATN